MGIKSVNIGYAHQCIVEEDRVRLYQPDLAGNIFTRSCVDRNVGILSDPQKFKGVVVPDQDHMPDLSEGL
jgi:hypothetical protein